MQGNHHSPRMLLSKRLWYWIPAWSEWNLVWAWDRIWGVGDGVDDGMERVVGRFQSFNDFVFKFPFWVKLSDC